MRLTRRDRLVLFSPLAVLLGGWLLLPALLGFMATFSTYSPFSTTLNFAGLDNYASVVSDPQFAAAARNLAIFTAVAVPLELVVGFGVAYILRLPVRGRTLWRILLLVPWLVSPIASGVMWHFLLGGATGILDFVLGWLGQPEAPSPMGDPRLALPTAIAVEVWRISPFVTFLLLPSLASIPTERWEDAILSGATWFGRLMNVALPSVRPLLLTITMLLVGLAFGTFDSVLILTGGGPGTATLTPALYSYSRAFVANDWPVGATAGWLIAAGVLAAGLVYLWLARQRAAE
ncbi:MAG TPA: sugar ABC transporter permease [Verrucomicrobiae bacterium]|nr:sugar ABC transporter permease [Verrucomicrobiae bacterium]